MIKLYIILTGRAHPPLELLPLSTYARKARPATEGVLGSEWTALICMFPLGSKARNWPGEGPCCGLLLKRALVKTGTHVWGYEAMCRRDGQLQDGGMATLAMKNVGLTGQQYPNLPYQACPPYPYSLHIFTSSSSLGLFLGQLAPFALDVGKYSRLSSVPTSFSHYFIHIVSVAEPV
jgi:hypothetical protein